MKFGEKIRVLRKSGNLTQKELGDLVGVGFTYISKIENERLDFGDYPSEDLIRKLAGALDGDEDELLILADKVPSSIRKRIKQNPEAFRLLATMSDEVLEELVAQHRNAARVVKR